MSRLLPILRYLFPARRELGFRHVRIVQVALLVVVAALLVFLIDFDKPWKSISLRDILFGAEQSLKHYISAGLYYAAAINALLCTGLCLTARWWARCLPAEAAHLQTTEEPLPQVGRWFYIALIVAMLAAGALRWNLAHGGLWWDEAWMLQKTVLGEWRMPDPETGEATFNPRKWKRTLWYYRKPTNHVPFAASSRLCLELWQKVTGREEHEFNEFVFRLPAFIAALLAVFLIGLLVRDCGFARAGPFAAFMLALHPWHIRYGIDGRSFSFVVLFTIVLCLALVRALRNNQWRYWLQATVAVFLLLWSFPYGLSLVALLGLATITALFARHGWTSTSVLCSGRLMVAYLLGGMLLLQMIAPHLPQITHWHDAIAGNTMINRRFLMELWAAITTGMPMEVREIGGEHLPRLTAYASWVKSLLIGTVPVLTLVGLIALWRRPSPAKWVVSALVVCAPLAVWLAYAQTHYFYTRYVIYGMVGLIVVMMIGAEFFGSLLDRKNRPYATYSVLGIVLAGFVFLTHAQRTMLQHYPIAPSREVAEFLSNVQDKATDREVIVVGFNLGGRPPRNYNPSMRWTIHAAEIPDFIAEAREKHADLYFYCGYSSFNRADEPDTFGYFEDPRLFEMVADFRGIEAAFYYRIFRYTGAPLKP